MFSTQHLKRKAISHGTSLPASAPAVFSSLAVLALALGPGAASAQQAPATKDQPVELEEVVVTGSQVTLPDGLFRRPGGARPVSRCHSVQAIGSFPLSLP